MKLRHMWTMTVGALLSAMTSASAQQPGFSFTDLPIVMTAYVEAAIDKLIAALQVFHIAGIKHNVPALIAILDSGEFRRGQVHTGLAGEVDQLRTHFGVSIDYPELLFFGLISDYLLRGRLRPLFGRIDAFFFRRGWLLRYSYRQFLTLRG